MSVVSSQNDHCANLHSWLGFILVLSVSRIDVFSEECFLLPILVGLLKGGGKPMFLLYKKIT